MPKSHHPKHRHPRRQGTPRRQRPRWLIIAAVAAVLLYAGAWVAGKGWSYVWHDRRAHRFIHAPY